MSLQKYKAFLDSSSEEDVGEEEENLSITQDFILTKLRQNKQASLVASTSTPVSLQRSNINSQFDKTDASPSSSTGSSSNLDETIDSNQSSNSNSTSNGESQDEIRELKKLLTKLAKQNEEILRRVQNLEDNAPKKKKVTVHVPNDVRYKVRQAYEERIKRGLCVWDMESNTGAFSNENLPITNYIRNFINGLYPDMENKDLITNSAIKTYYESKLTTCRRKKKNPSQSKDAAKSQRKIHKAERRKKAFKSYVELKDEEMKENIMLAIVPEMMSSEEEADDENGDHYFLVKKPTFRSKKFDKVLRLADDAYLKNISKPSRNQTVRREEASPSKRRKPDSLKFGYDIFIKK